MTNTKKIGRPAGSKNKPKAVKLLELQVKDGKKKANLNKVDWEALAKNLQQALAKEMKENEMLEADNIALTRGAIKLEGIIQYLESKFGNDPV